MEFREIFRICLLFGLIINVQCAKIYISHAPKTLTFGPSEVLRLSDIGDLIAGSLGYTTIGTWPGLTVNSPFGYPLAFVLVNVKSNGHDVNMDGHMYKVKQESSINAAYEFVQRKLKAQSERPLSFQDIFLSNLQTAELKQVFQSDPVSLNEAVVEDNDFIHQMEVLTSVIEKIEKYSSIGHGGQDITFVEVDALNPLISKYGANSSQVKEADDILKKSLIELKERVRKLYGNRVVFASVFTDDMHSISKRATFTDNKEDMDDINLASPYSEDFPVIFNIVLFLSILLIFAIIASSASMALMDPGHDSIIYRMTNPRMKKD